MNRRGYIDWLRGISVLIMIEAHTLDAWTRLSERGNALYGWAMVVGILSGTWSTIAVAVPVTIVVYMIKDKTLQAASTPDVRAKV